MTRRRKVTIIATLIAAITLVSTLSYALQEQPADYGVPRAAIIDQLTLDIPNPAFISHAVSLLTDAGFQVDVYSGGQATVDLYRSLPMRGYRLIVFRLHTATVNRPSSRSYPAFLFTGELYRDNFNVIETFTNPLYRELLDGRVFPAKVYEETPAYFALGPEFVRRSMTGRFNQTVVVVMSCYGMWNDALAETFIDRGAAAFVGWTDLISATHSDETGEVLLDSLVTNRTNVKAAVDYTMSEVGLDPFYPDAILAAYPQESEHVTLFP